MVTRTRVTLGLAGLLAGGAGACNWTTFDDLSSEVWVERVNNPDDSRQYGVALGALPDTADTLDGQGANLVVLGRAKLMVSTLRYGGDGKHAVSSVGGQAIFPAFMFDDLPAKPAFAVDPTDHRFAFGSLTGNTLAGQGFIGVMDGDNLGVAVAPARVFIGSDMALSMLAPTGIAFATIPDAGGFTNDPALGELVVARGSQLDVMYDYANAAITDVAGFAECRQATSRDRAVVRGGGGRPQGDAAPGSRSAWGRGRPPTAPPRELRIYQWARWSRPSRRSTCRPTVTRRRRRSGCRRSTPASRC
jgi:hypothetical protein